MSWERGELFEKAGKAEFEWRISVSTFLNPEVGNLFYSNLFHFANACWHLGIIQRGQNEEQSQDSIALGICRIDHGPPKEFRMTLKLKTADGKQTLVIGKKMFSRESSARGNEFIKLSELRKRKSNLAPLDVLTVICTLESDDYQHTAGSLFARLWNLSGSLHNILYLRKRTDVVLKLTDGEIPAHRMILQSQSAVFNRMFDVDMQEAQIGEVNIEDGDEKTFKVVLAYIYTGQPRGLCVENMCEVYKAAHKYELRVLRKLCVDYMKVSLTIFTIVDVIVLAHFYQETSLKECAKNYFTKHKTLVLKTPQWKKMEIENPACGLEVMKYVFGE